MASTYSNNLRLELIGTGDQAGTWGNTTNTNIGTLIEKAVSGSESVTVSAANTALTALNGADDQSRNMMLVLDTSTGANFAVYAPPSPKIYVIYNASSYTATIYNSTVLGNTTAAGTGIAVATGQSLFVFTDGTNFRTINAANLTGLLSVANGGTGASSITANNVVLGNGTSPVQTVAPGTDNNVLRSDGTTWVSEALGSMADQNSNSVSITGGSISGITDLAVADGGTGASTASGARTNLGLGTVSTINTTGSTSTFLRGDGSFNAVPIPDTLGVNQSWGGTLSTGTVYQNTYGRSIAIGVNGSAYSGDILVSSYNGGFFRVQGNSAGTAVWSNSFAIIPPGWWWYYSGSVQQCYSRLS